ncbi:putative cytosolic protein [Granulibacter bethesdensis]|uniref:Cytosolic protein n=2 Tax=Granulibacter bethesdensis TaxID=364410 RepID=A0AAN0REX6_9PROT|nr:putative cytosolic protein [Granulibacter bethesdensis]
MVTEGTGRMAHNSLLQAPEDEAPVMVLRPEAETDILLVVDHAGRAIPRQLGLLGLAPAELDRHIAWDIGIAGVSEALSQHLDATCIMQRYSRLVIDCNRPLHVPSAIPEISENTRIPGNAGLDEAEREARRGEIYAPYHARIAAELDRRAGRNTVLVAMHSFTPVYKGEVREMQAGVLYNRHTALPHIMLDLLRAENGLVVGDNAPYSVSDETDYTIPFHAERRGLAYLEMEIRQDLIADAAGQAEWAERMARLLRIGISRLIG